MPSNPEEEALRSRAAEQLSANGLAVTLTRGAFRLLLGKNLPAAAEQSIYLPLAQQVVEQFPVIGCVLRKALLQGISSASGPTLFAPHFGYRVPAGTGRPKRAEFSAQFFPDDSSAIIGLAGEMVLEVK